MEEKSCRCGASKKRFKYDIGPFFVAECCTAAGYDDLGNPKKSTPFGGSPIEVDPSVVLVKTDGVTTVKLAQPEAEQEELSPGPNEGEAPESAPEEASTLRKFFGLGTKLKAGGRGKLMDMTVEQLKVIAKEKGIEVAEMNKKQIVAAILG